MKVITFETRKQLNGQEVILYPSLLQVNGRNYLVDCGYEETFDEFVAALKDLGVCIGDLHGIIISHDDIDHLGAVHLFKGRNRDLLIYCSDIEAPSVSGKTASERLLQAERSLAQIPEAHKEGALHFIEQLKAIKRLPVDRTVSDHDDIDEGIVAIHTPGHTKGHISLYLPSEKIVIANDAIVLEEGGELNIANPAYTLDMQAALQSVEKIKDLKPERLVCYHGGVLEKEVLKKLDTLIGRYRNEQSP